MTNKRGTKRALLLSGLALLLCVSMLIGSTYAWFTDSVTSSGNIIKSGKLDVEMNWKDATASGAQQTYTDASQMPIFNYDKWEPGYVEAKNIEIQNKGTLALKYQLSIVAEGVVSELADVIDVYYAEGEYTLNSRNMSELEYLGKLSDVLSTLEEPASGDLVSGESDKVTLALKMRESAGNEYQNKSIGTSFAVKLFATQLTSEKDSFDESYDAGAEEEFDKIVDEGSFGGIYWTLTENGKLTVSPATEAYYDPTSLKTYEVGVWREAVVYQNGSAKAIGGHPYDVNAVKSLVIEEGVTHIGSFAAKFPNLEGTVVIPSTVTYFGQEAFQNTKIDELIFAEGGTGVLCIAPGALKGIRVEELVFPADRPEIHIHSWVFNDCLGLKRVTFPSNTQFLGQTHLEYCGMDRYYSGDSQVLARCWALKTITFGSQAAHDSFFNAAGNRGNINAIGGVEIIVAQ